MYIKTTCPHCVKNSFHDIQVTITESKKDSRLTEVEVKDTLREEDLIQMVSNFVSQSIESGTQDKELQDILNRCLGISPQFTEELLLKIQNKKKCKKAKQSL